MGERKGALISKGNIFPLYLWLFSLGCIILLWFFYCCCDLRLRRLLSSNTNQICKAPSKQQEGRRRGEKKKVLRSEFAVASNAISLRLFIAGAWTCQHPGHPRQPWPATATQAWKGVIRLVRRILCKRRRRSLSEVYFGRDEDTTLRLNPDVTCILYSCPVIVITLVCLRVIYITN